MNFDNLHTFGVFLILAILTYIVWECCRWFFDPIVSALFDNPPLSYRHNIHGSDTPFPRLVVEDTDPAASLSSSSPSAFRGNSHSYTFSPITVTPSSLTLSVVVPSYNEELRLAKMMDETILFLSNKSQKEKNFTWEIIIVDDGSKDKTVSVAMNYVKQYGSNLIRVLKLSRNQGKGGAVQQGCLHSRGEFILMCDADGATRFSDIELLLAAAHEELAKSSSSSSPSSSSNKNNKNPSLPGHVVIVGSRAHLAQQAVATRKWYRNVLMYGFHFLVSTLCIRNIQDTQCGFKLFTRNTAAVLFSNQHLRRWCFDVELLYLCQQLGISVREISVNWCEIEGSKVNLVESSFMMGRDLVIIKMAYMTRWWKVHESTKKMLLGVVRTGGKGQGKDEKKEEQSSEDSPSSSSSSSSSSSTLSKKSRSKKAD